MLKRLLGRHEPVKDPAAEIAGQSIVAMDRLFTLYLGQVHARSARDPADALAYQKALLAKLIGLDPADAMRRRGEIYLEESASWPAEAQASFYGRLELPWAPSPEDEVFWRGLAPVTRGRYLAQGAAMNAQVLTAILS